MYPNNIRYCRMMSKKSLAETATHLGMSVSNYSKIERQELDITLQNFIKLARFFKVSLSDLAGFKKYILKPSTEEIRKDGEKLIEIADFLELYKMQMMANVVEHSNMKNIYDLFKKSIKEKYKLDDKEIEEKMIDIVKENFDLIIPK